LNIEIWILGEQIAMETEGTDDEEEDDDDESREVICNFGFRGLAYV
jgi:hypothetical protein